MKYIKVQELLFGQDSSSFWIKEEREEWPVRPYARFLNEFVPYCAKEGIEKELINKIIKENSRRALSHR